MVVASIRDAQRNTCVTEYKLKQDFVVSGCLPDRAHCICHLLHKKKKTTILALKQTEERQQLILHYTVGNRHTKRHRRKHVYAFVFFQGRAEESGQQRGRAFQSLHVLLRLPHTHTVTHPHKPHSSPKANPHTLTPRLLNLQTQSNALSAQLFLSLFFISLKLSPYFFFKLSLIFPNFLFFVFVFVLATPPKDPFHLFVTAPQKPAWCPC